MRVNILFSSFVVELDVLETARAHLFLHMKSITKTNGFRKSWNVGRIIVGIVGEKYCCGMGGRFSNLNGEVCCDVCTPKAIDFVGILQPGAYYRAVSHKAARGIR